MRKRIGWGENKSWELIWLERLKTSWKVAGIAGKNSKNIMYLKLNFYI
jgi:hypothetical protein